MKTLVIEREAVKNNIGVIKERAGEAVIYAVLTGDGQGAGLVELARLLREEGIGRFAVSEPAEAAALRRAGFVEEEILMLRPTVDRAELEQLIDLNVVCTVGSADTGMALNGAAEARSTVVEAHIQIDTGMGFGGFLADEPEKILSVYRNLPNVAVSGICTQLHARKKGGEDLAARLGQFHRVVEAIRAAGFETGVVHAAGSYALLHCADARLDGVRAGSALLGRCRRVHGDGLYRVGYGEVGIEETRWLPKGHTVGSARPVVLRRPTRVAVLPVGYQNGFGVARAQGSGLGALLRRWLAARRRYRLILRPDTLEQITWRGRTVISLRNTTAEIRIPAGIRAARTAHLPCLCLRREGQVVFSLPTYTLRSRDQRTMAEFFRRSTDLPLRHISFLT